MVDEELALISFEYGEDNGFGGLCAIGDESKILQYVSNILGLNPVLNEIRWIKSKTGGSIYITADGLRTVTFDKVKSNVSELIDYDKEHMPPHWAIYRCTVSTIDGRLFSQEGAWDISELKGNKKASLHYVRSMAETRAVSRTLRLLAKGLRFFDDLPDELKQNAIVFDDVKEEPITDYLNEDLEVKEEVEEKKKEEKPIYEIALEEGFDPTADLVSSIPEKEPEIVREKKTKKVKKAKDELLAMFDDMLDDPIIVEPPTLEEELKKIELPLASGHGFVIECVKIVNPINKERCIEILSKPESEECIYFFDWFRTIIINNFHDAKCIKGADPKKISPPIMVYELLTKKSIEIQGTGKYWVDCILDNDKDALQGLLFSVLVDLFDRHKKSEVNEYPHKPLVKRYVNGSTPLTNWIMKLYKDQEEMELP